MDFKLTLRLKRNSKTFTSQWDCLDWLRKHGLPESYYLPEPMNAEVDDVVVLVDEAFARLFFGNVCNARCDVPLDMLMPGEIISKAITHPNLTLNKNISVQRAKDLFLAVNFTKRDDES